jgi:hypothetical protein
MYDPATICHDTIFSFQHNTFQWLVTLSCFTLSGAVIAIALFHVTRENKKICFLVIVVVLAIHLLIACGFMLFFFHVPQMQKIGQKESLSKTIQMHGGKVVTSWSRSGWLSLVVDG